MRRAGFLSVLILIVIAMTAMSASAQWGGRNANTSSLGVSFAYGGDPDGLRLEYTTDKFVVDGLYFQDDSRDSDIMGVEFGWKAGDTGGAGNALVAGAGYYNDDPTVGVDDSGIGWWAGMGDFGGGRGGMFYQFRYIFNGPLEGTQGILGWRF